MEYLQYLECGRATIGVKSFSFKPYYKWNTFNTHEDKRSGITRTVF